VTDFAHCIMPEVTLEKSQKTPQGFFNGAQVIKRSESRLGDDINVRHLSFIDPESSRMTDCYEVYWAHFMPTDEGQLRTILKWLGELDLWNLPSNLRRQVWSFALILSACAFALPFYPQLGDSAVEFLQFRIDWILFLIFSGLMYWLRHSLIEIVGDAATYLHSSPATFRAKKDIRDYSSRLINDLHEAKESDGSIKYDRIIVVGHSLGTFIAYDALQQCFAQRNQGADIYDLIRLKKRYDEKANYTEKGVSTVLGEEIDSILEPAKKLYDYEDNLNSHQVAGAFNYPVFGAGNKSTYWFPSCDPLIKYAQNSYREAQRKFFIAQREFFTHYINQSDYKNQPDPKTYPPLDWRVTDFVTLGSPMTYAAFLLDPKDDQLRNERTFLQKELHKLYDSHWRGTTWPLSHWRGTTWPLSLCFRYRRSADMATVPPRILTNREMKPYFFLNDEYGNVALLNRSCFAITRWTNIYVPSNGNIRSGDILSGPLGPVFGLGIRDIAINPKEFARQGWSLSRFAHTRYWSCQGWIGAKQADPETDPPWVEALRYAIDLNFKNDLPENDECKEIRHYRKPFFNNRKLTK